MSIFSSFLLGLIQGVAEFLPISSSGHLAIAQNLLGLQTEIPEFFDVLLHLGTLLAVFVAYWQDIKDMVAGFKHRRSSNVVNFQKAKKQAERQQQSAPYRHKCAVCGKTDAEYPELEFRYCSRCSGYHCYCAEHINAHRHISE